MDRGSQVRLAQIFLDGMLCLCSPSWNDVGSLRGLCCCTLCLVGTEMSQQPPLCHQVNVHQGTDGLGATWS